MTTSSPAVTRASNSAKFEAASSTLTGQAGNIHVGTTDPIPQALEVELNDPDSLWDVVAEFSLSKWLKRTRNFPGGIGHRFKDAAHRRVWIIGRRIRDEYAGDARLIWRNRTAAEAAEGMDELGVGPNISRMAAGGLADTGWIKGRSDVKADVHVCRALGRTLVGGPFEPDAAVALAREVDPRNPMAARWASISDRQEILLCNRTGLF